MKTFFLISFTVSLLALLATAEQNFHHLQASQPQVTRNDRGIENNRDFSNMVQQGLSYGLFKVAQGGVQDCTLEGMTLARAALGLIRNMAVGKTKERDVENLVEFLGLLSERCNYMATPQGQLVASMLHDRIENSSRFGVPLAALLSSVVFMANLYDMFAVFFYRGISLFHHKDAYNFSVIVGKVINIMFELFMLGLAFKHVTDPVSW